MLTIHLNRNHQKQTISKFWNFIYILNNTIWQFQTSNTFHIQSQKFVHRKIKYVLCPTQKTNTLIHIILISASQFSQRSFIWFYLKFNSWIKFIKIREDFSKRHLGLWNSTWKRFSATYLNQTKLTLICNIINNRQNKLRSLSWKWWWG